MKTVLRVKNVKKHGKQGQSVATLGHRRLVVVKKGKPDHATAQGMEQQALVDPNDIRFARIPKSVTLRFRVDPFRYKGWVEAMEKLRVDDFSSYARQAIGRAIFQDLRTADPKWQSFVEATRPLAISILGYDISDNAEDRTENLTQIEKLLADRARELQVGEKNKA